MDKLSDGVQQRPRPKTFRLACSVVLLCLASLFFQYRFTQNAQNVVKVPLHAAETISKCRSLNEIPAPPKDFRSRTVSDRFVPGTRPTLIRNATIWTGNIDGHEVIKGDILLDKGIIKQVGKVTPKVLDAYGSDLVSVDANGSWVTPGLVDMHSHLGVDSSPNLKGASDTNSRKGLTQPWLRSLDGLNTHDDAFALSISGGLTTAVILPGSANAIGGQAFVIKLRHTDERSSSAMLVEPPHNLLLNGTEEAFPLRWRQMKQACGENPSRIYSGTRMDTIWAFRQAYDTARQLKEKQDEYCTAALNGDWKAIGGQKFPEELQWEMLVDVLRGRVKIHTHCYEPVDLDGIVRLTNEFKFPIAAFHHAHSAYLVPELLKKTWGNPPAIAMFAINGRYKREAYRISEFAPRILADAGFDVVMKSDHPVQNSRYLLFDAQQAYFYGLKSNLALASVTTTPARVIGMDHRIGSIEKGYDADVVIWDSHPLALGATPVQVFIDGIPQLNSTKSKKPDTFQTVPKTPDFNKEVEATLKYDGLPPLQVDQGNLQQGSVLFYNVGSLYLRSADGSGIDEMILNPETGLDQSHIVVIENGHIVCVGPCPDHQLVTEKIDLQGGSIAPSLISYGSPLGLVTINAEASTNDGGVPDPLLDRKSEFLHVPIVRAIDGLEFETRDALYAYRAGVSVGIVAPVPAGDNLLHGLSTAFSTSAPHKLSEGAVVQEVTAVHFEISMNSKYSVSTQIGLLRKVLLGVIDGDLASHAESIMKGLIPIVISVESADIMSSLVLLKKEVESLTGFSIRMVFSGATEAHLIAEEIARAGVGVIVTAVRPFPATWEKRRILPGPPLSNSSAISVLLANNVTVGIGVSQNTFVRNTRFDMAWVALDSGGSISRADALALASTNLEKLLGIYKENQNLDLVVTKGASLFEFSQVVGIVTPRRGGFVHLM